MFHRFKQKVHIKKDSKFDKRTLLIVIVSFGVLGTAVIGLSHAADNTPTTDGFTNVVNNPIDPAYLTNVPFGARSDYMQAWRAYMDTVPATTLLDSVGVNFNISGNNIEPTARLLAANGFKRVRVEFGWNSMDYDNPTQLTAANQQKVQQYMTTFKKYGLRPLIVLNANSGGPVPAKNFSVTVTQPAKTGDRVIHIDPTAIPQIVLNYSGSKFSDPDAAQAKYRFTSITPDGTATLSYPLRTDVPAGVYTNGTSTQKFQPFFPPTQDNGQPSPEFNATMQGWLDYTGAITKAVKQSWGSDDFDVEIWNELSFGSAFLQAGNYFSPMPTGYSSLGSGQQPILLNTITYIRNPANGVTNIKIGNGFTNQSPWGSGVNQYPGINAIDKHPYSGPLYRPVQGQGGNPIDATGQIDPTAVRSCVLTGDHTKPASWTDANKDGHVGVNEVCTGLNGMFSPKEPRYSQIMPEAFLNVATTETIIRDLAPFDNPVQGGAHGRNTKACPSCTPPVLWITEVNLSPYSGQTALKPDGTYTYIPRTAPEADHIAAKNYLRYLVAWVNKGAKAIDFYAANAGDLSVINKSFFDALTAGSIKQNPTFYPGNNTGGPSVNAINNLTQIMKQGTAPITQPRQLTLTKIADNHNHMQFDKTDNTPGHPPLYDRDVLAVLPFQVNDSRFAIPAYVMTRDVSKVYNANAPADGTKYDLPPEAFQMTLGGFNPAKIYAASAVDPLTNLATPASIVSQSGGTIVVQADLTDSPRVIVLAESGSGSGSAPADTTAPDTRITVAPSGTRAKNSVSFSFTSTENDSTFECKLDNANFTSCTSPMTFASLAVGTHTFGFRTTDAAGNVDPSPATYAWTIEAPKVTGDTTPPDTNISPVSSTTLGGSSATFTFASSEGAGATFECQLDSGNFTSCTSPKNYTNLLAGFHTFKVRAIDAAGNTDTSPASYTWLASSSLSDTTDPAVNITTPANGASVTGIVTATAAASDNLAVTRVDFALDGNSRLSDTAAPYNYSFDSKTVSNGSHTITATAYDQAGNSTLTTITVHVNNPDTTPPQAPTNLNATAPNATTVNLTWTAAADTGANPSGVAKYNVLRNGIVVAQPTGTSYTDTGRVSNTSYVYTIQAVDGAGNVSSNSSSKTITTPTAPDTTDPNSPGNLAAAAVSVNQVNLSWSASTDTGGSGIAGYNVYRGNTKLNSSLVTATSYGDTTAAAGKTYGYTVEAVDGAGNVSAKTSAVNATTPQGIRGDVTGAVNAPDGKIDLRDISFLIRKYNSNDASADINGPNGSPDGKVDLYDLSYVIRNYGK